MQIKYSTETEEGTVVFQGTLEGPELTLVLETGLNELMKRGLIPFLSTETFDPMNLMELPDLDQ